MNAKTARIKSIALLFFFITPALLVADSLDLSKPVPRVRLSDGRILQNATFVKFGASDVLIRHSAGSSVLLYEALPVELRGAAEQKRPGGPRWFAGETAKDAVRVSGQVFLQTQGAGPYKFGAARVMAFPVQYLERWNDTKPDDIIKLPQPLAESETDADGKFELNLPHETPFFLFCQTYRLLADGSGRHSEWRVPSDSFKNLARANLTNDNNCMPSRVEIEPVR